MLRRHRALVTVVAAVTLVLGLAVPAWAINSYNASPAPERTEVGALQVLDECALERDLLDDVLDDDGHLVKPRTLGGAPAALAGDQLVATGGAWPNEHGLDDAGRAHRVGKACARVGVEASSRLLRPAPRRARRR